MIIAVAIGLVSSFHAQILYHNANVDSIASTEKQEKQIISDYAKSVNEKENAVKVIWRYGTYSPCYSLQFGNEYTGSAFNEEISLICHGQSDVNAVNQKTLSVSYPTSFTKAKWNLMIANKTFKADYASLSEYGIVKEYPYGLIVVYNKESMP